MCLVKAAGPIAASIDTPEIESAEINKQRTNRDHKVWL
jgi:hypothetical protein